MVTHYSQGKHERDYSQNPVSQEGDIIISAGRRYRLLGTAKDPFAANCDQGVSPQTIHEAEERISRKRERRRAS